jgi:hypothetical protein
MPYRYIIGLKNLEPLASETLLLASRSQHIGRWKIQREAYPAGKTGYFKWRTELAKFHANTAAALLSEVGYNANEVERVQKIILKKNLKADPEVQVMENALCLVFLQFQYQDFIGKHDDSKVIRILQKSWTKMDQTGRDAALTLSFTEKGEELLEKALGN